MYAALECVIDSIVLYMLYFKKMNSNYTRNDRYSHTKNALIANEKEIIQFEVTINTKKIDFNRTISLERKNIFNN